MNRSNSESIEGSKTGGADFLQLDVSQAPPGGITDWLTARLRAAIAEGTLSVGSRLPAGRVLAAELGVSRGVVTEAYRRLGEDGHVVGRGRAGTVVVAVPVTAPAPGPVPAHHRSADPFAAPPEDDAFDALRAAPARIDLSPGLPDLAAFPRTAWLRAHRAVLDELGAGDLGYGDPRGAFPLRRAVSGWLARNRGISVGPGEVVVVSGVAQALALLAQILRGQGVTAVAVEEPGSLGARRHLAYWGMDTPPVDVDDRGLDVDRLRATGAAAALLTPAHQFPTGAVLSGDRRRDLGRWAGDGGLVLEDDYDAEHRYGRPPVPAVQAMLPESTYYTGSVSKLLAPALRTGWVVVPPRHREALVNAKRYADLGGAVLPQLVLARLMDSGDLERHLRLLRRRHRRRRDAMLEAIARHLPGARVHGSAAGLNLMVTFDGDSEDRHLAAAALEYGVKIHPLSWHRQRRRARPGVVLGYAARTPTEIAEGVALLARALRALG
ncbi:MocR-like pyridoxine biosynthesis transcription factor PdxR [Halostreptopolyspora alba]|uniref:PLP-dependent aminotransferase family protein n=1 Tax=Halostreptopolyspora alba TaxID=2487137 RepID=A0A3N0EGL2_9ACTN|nr:PLP-dependent aminotransferase family protein [Nocardiopsaceae bacterium YIM 96095]